MWLAFGSYGNAHSAEAAAGLHCFGGVGVALDEGAEFSDAGFVLFELDEGLTFVEVGDGNFVAVGVLLEDAVVVLYGGGVVAAAVFDLAEIVASVSGEWIVGVVFDDVGELGPGEGVLGGHVVAEGGLVELVGGGGVG